MNHTNTVMVAIFSALEVMLIAGLAITPAQIQSAHAKSLIGDYASGYEAGKSAAKAGSSDTCDGSGTLYCTGFHVGWAAARNAMNTLD
jgi:hypothetical protein